MKKIHQQKGNNYTIVHVLCLCSAFGEKLPINQFEDSEAESGSQGPEKPSNSNERTAIM